MEQSLSLVLPVADAQATLAETVAEILEVLSELTSRFEVVIVDDGSSDDTLAVADELAARYPQVVVAAHCRPLGRQAAIQTGIRHSHGEILLLRDAGSSAFGRLARTDPPQSIPAEGMRPSYLAKLRDFAFGE